MSSQYNPSANVLTNKNTLRAKMREARQQLCPYDREAQSLLIIDRLVNLLEDLSPRKVGLYLATPLEVNLDSLIEQLHVQQIEVYLPHLEDQLTPFHQFLSWESLESGPLDLRHPPAESPSIAAASLDVIIVPGLAFDLLHKINKSPELLDKIPNGTTIDFIEKDFPKKEKDAVIKKRKYIRIKNEFEI